MHLCHCLLGEHMVHYIISRCNGYMFWIMLLGIFFVGKMSCYVSCYVVRGVVTFYIVFGTVS